ncbi:MAG TPA: hypothetical protein VJ644_07415 [Jiangellaceae bacterium]|nr:hypothetical protein [Jiangellaceae bacterium]
MQLAAEPARDFIDLIGLEIDDASADRVAAHLTVRPERLHVQSTADLGRPA